MKQQAPFDLTSTCARIAVAMLALVLWGAAGCSSAIVHDTGPVLYPPLPEKPRFQYLTSFTSELDLRGKSAFEDFLLGEETEERTLRKPYGVAMDGSRVYVTDTVLKRIVVIDMKERTFADLRGDAGPGKVDTPINVTVSADHHKWVADAGRGQILEYGADDRFLRALGEKGQFKPTDVAVAGDLVYVCDVQDQEIEVLSRRTGRVQRKLGKPGSEAGSFTFPTNIAVDKDGNVYVSDTGNFRVQKLSPDGELLGQFGSIGDAPGTFTRPKGIDVDPDGRVFVVDAAFENVQVFDPDFRLLLSIGGPGTEPGNLYLPSDVQIVPGGEKWFASYAAPEMRLQYVVLVVSQYGPRRVNVFGYGQWTGSAPGAASAPAEHEMGSTKR